MESRLRDSGNLRRLGQHLKAQGYDNDVEVLSSWEPERLEERN